MVKLLQGVNLISLSRKVMEVIVNNPAIKMMRQVQTKNSQKVVLLQDLHSKEQGPAGRKGAEKNQEAEVNLLSDLKMKKRQKSPKSLKSQNLKNQCSHHLQNQSQKTLLMAGKQIKLNIQLQICLVHNPKRYKV